MKVKIAGLSLNSAREVKRVMAAAPTIARKATDATLPLLQLPVFKVLQRDLEAFIVARFAFEEFDFCLATGTKPGQTTEYRVSGDLRTLEMQRRGNELRSGRRTRDIQLILNVLANASEIPIGVYLVDTRAPLPERVIYRQLLQQTENPLAAECLKFKEEQKHDAKFVKWAATLDRIVLDQLAGRAA